MKIDITVEFYHKSAIYNSRVTGAKVHIIIKEVFLTVFDNYKKDKSLPTTKAMACTIVSDKGAHYGLNELEF